eukprot:scaffold21720_cov126-Isochrysis_galbana.AAC.7
MGWAPRLSHCISTSTCGRAWGPSDPVMGDLLCSPTRGHRRESSTQKKTLLVGANASREIWCEGSPPSSTSGYKVFL